MRDGDCPQLPSVQAVCDYYDGVPGWQGEVAYAMGTRALMIAAGMFLVGERDPKKLVAGAAAASAVIETWVFLRVKRHREEGAVARENSSVAKQVWHRNPLDRYKTVKPVAMWDWARGGLVFKGPSLHRFEDGPESHNDLEHPDSRRVRRTPFHEGG